MKPPMYSALWGAFVFVVLGVGSVRIAGAVELAGGAPVTLKAVDAAPTSAEWMQTAYLALVRESIVPANARVVANAALAKLAAIAPDRVLPLPIAFGHDAERDAAWLAERVADLSPPWPVLDAMARAADTAHVGLGTPERRRGIGALMAGKPLAAPGFNLYPLVDGRLVVFDVIKGASADVSGLRVGDVLLRIDGAKAVRADVFLLNALPAGEELKLEIERADRPEVIVLRLIKADVAPVESRLLDGEIGYVFVRWFARSVDGERDTAALARRAIKKFAVQNARGLVVDLRSSLGGTGEVSMASALCDSEIIYSIQQPRTAPARAVKRDGERDWSRRPMVILVNEFTVSAGEALALALRELVHAKIVGRTTAGGLTEMSFVPLADGYAMTIPTGVVLGPVSGEVPSGFALKPDVEVPNASIEKLLSGRDDQLAAARALLDAGPALR